MVIWTRPVKESLKQIHDFISSDSGFYADKVVDEIISLSLQIQNFPQKGRKVPEINEENTRELVIYSYRLIYEISESDICILAIVHTSRDFKELLNQ